jgi:hypothetical protein
LSFRSGVDILFESLSKRPAYFEHKRDYFENSGTWFALDFVMFRSIFGRFAATVIVFSFVVVIDMTQAGFAQTLNFKSQESMKVIRLVLDLDWTLIAPVPDHHIQVDPSHLITAHGEVNRLVLNTGAFLQALSKIPGVEISFFGGGLQPRLEAITRAIKLPNGLTAYDLARMNGGLIRPGTKARLFDNEYMTEVKDVPEGVDPHNVQHMRAMHLRFTDFFKKNLSKIFGVDGDLSRTILIEDQKDFAAAGQEQNLLWLQNPYNYYEDYDHWKATRPPGPLDAYDPPDLARWYLERNKLAWALGLIKTAVEVSSRGADPVTGDSPLTLTEALWRLQHDKNGIIMRDSDSQIALFQKGLRAMGLPALPAREIKCGLALAL